MYTNLTSEAKKQKPTAKRLGVEKEWPRRRGVSGGMDGRCWEALSERSETKRVWLHGTRTAFPQ